MTIEIRKTEDLFRHYERQTEAQDCYVELDCEAGVLRASFNGEIGNAVPVAVYHDRVLRWAIPCLTSEAADELLEELRPLAERVVAGYSCEWNGSNHVGKLNADADAASDEIERRCEAAEGRRIEEWTAEEWFEHSTVADLGVTADTTDEALEARAEELMAEARGDTSRDGEVRLTGCEEYLRERRDELRAAGEDVD